MLQCWGGPWWPGLGIWVSRLPWQGGGLAPDTLNFLYLWLAWVTTLMQRIQLGAAIRKRCIKPGMGVGEWSQDKRKESESRSVVSDSLRPHRLHSPWNSPGQNTGVGSRPSSGDLPNPGIKPRSPALQEGSLPAELSGKSCGVRIPFHF